MFFTPPAATPRVLYPKRTSGKRLLGHRPQSIHRQAVSCCLQSVSRCRPNGRDCEQRKGCSSSFLLGGPGRRNISARKCARIGELHGSSVREGETAVRTSAHTLSSQVVCCDE